MSLSNRQASKFFREAVLISLASLFFSAFRPPRSKPARFPGRRLHKRRLPRRRYAPRKTLRA